MQEWQFFAAQAAGVVCCCLVCGAGLAGGSLLHQAVGTVLLGLLGLAVYGGSSEVLRLHEAFP